MIVIFKGKEYKIDKAICFREENIYFYENGWYYVDSAYNYNYSDVLFSDEILIYRMPGKSFWESNNAIRSAETNIYHTLIKGPSEKYDSNS